MKILTRLAAINFIYLQISMYYVHTHLDSCNTLSEKDYCIKLEIII